MIMKIIEMWRLNVKAAVTNRWISPPRKRKRTKQITHHLEKTDSKKLLLYKGVFVFVCHWLIVGFM